MQYLLYSIGFKSNILKYLYSPVIQESSVDFTLNGTVSFSVNINK